MVVGFLIAKLFLTAALAQQASPTTEPSPSPTPKPVVCSPEFTNLYMNTSTELRTVLAYIRVNNIPPNLSEAVHYCTQILTQFPGQSCVIPTSTSVTPISTDDFAKICEATLSLGKKTNTPNVPADSVVLLKPSAVTIEILDPAGMAKLIEKPRGRYVIKGQIRELMDAALDPSPVRCTVDIRQGTKPVVTSGELFKFTEVPQFYSGGFRVTGLVPDGKDYSFMCVTPAPAILTLTQLKEALGSLVEITP